MKTRRTNHTMMLGHLGALALILVPIGNATAEGCQALSEADSATYNKIDLSVAGGDTFYLEERFLPPLLALNPPIPMSGFVASALGDGGGTWLYSESNGLPGLQRGGLGFLGESFPPGCDQTVDGINADTNGGGPTVEHDGGALLDISNSNPLHWTINDPVSWAQGWHHNGPDTSTWGTIPCTVVGRDPITDMDSCGIGSDFLILGMLYADEKGIHEIVDSPDLV